MIFVTVGFHYQGFNRLIMKMDEIAPSLNDKIIMQIGNSDYIPKNTEWFTFIDDDSEIENIIENSKLIISHGGAGTILTVLSKGKPLVVVPRLKKYNEHVDDQQLELAEILSSRGIIAIVNEVDQLPSVIESVMFKDIIKVQPTKTLVSYLKGLL